MHLLNTENNRDGGVGVTLLPLFDSENNTTIMSKNITEISREGSSAPGFMQGTDPGISQKKKAWS